MTSGGEEFDCGEEGISQNYRQMYLTRHSADLQDADGFASNDSNEAEEHWHNVYPALASVSEWDVYEQLDEALLQYDDRNTVEQFSHEDNSDIEEEACDFDIRREMVERLGVLGWYIYQRVRDGVFGEIDFSTGFIRPLMDFFLAQLYGDRSTTTTTTSSLSQRCCSGDTDHNLTAENDDILLAVLACFPSLSDITKLLADRTVFEGKDWIVCKTVLDMYNAYLRVYDTPLLEVYRSSLLPCVIRFYETIPTRALLSITMQLKHLTSDIEYSAAKIADTFVLFDTREEYLAYYRLKLRDLRNMCEGCDSDLYIL